MINPEQAGTNESLGDEATAQKSVALPGEEQCQGMSKHPGFWTVGSGIWDLYAIFNSAFISVCETLAGEYRVK